METYWQLKIKVDEKYREIISALLFENFLPDGVVIDEEEYKDLEKISSSSFMSAFFSAPPDKSQVDEVIKNAISGEFSFETELLELKNQDWSEEWKKNWQPARISDRVVICPTWREYEANEGEIIINLDPGSAFGTGTHPTTQLCILAMEKYIKPNWELADIGCGSGILAIAGVKLGAKSAVAIDNDELVIPVAKDNATLNNVDDKIKFFTAEAQDLKGKTYDFVCANILHNVLAEIMSDLKALLKQGGKMVLSGILDEKEAVVTEALKRENLSLTERLKKDNWVALVVGKE